MSKFGVLTLLIVISIFFSTQLRAQTIPVPSSDIDLLIEGKNYTPPFYKGRALWSDQSMVNIVAIPHIPGISNTSNLNYKWTKNNVVLGTVSGRGMNSLTFVDSVLGNPQQIKIEVLSNDSAILASRIITISAVSPSLLIYEDNPLYGVLFNKETGSAYELQDQEVTFTAFPLFFTAINRFDDSIRYAWRTNQGDSEAQNSVTYRAPEGVFGSSSITVGAEHQNRIMQAANQNFLVTFGSESNF